MSEIIKLSSRYTAFVKHDDKSHDTVICEENVLLHCQLSNNQRDILESLIYSIYQGAILVSTIKDLAFFPSLMRARGEITAAVIRFWSTASCNI